MFNSVRTLMDIEMDRYRPSIDRPPMSISCMPNPIWQTPQYRGDSHGSLYDVTDYKQEPVYKKDIIGGVYDSNDPCCIRPIAQVDIEGNIIDPLRPYTPIGSIVNGY